MLIQAQVLAASSLTTDQIIDVVAILVPLLIAFAGGIFLIYRWRHRAERTVRIDAYNKLHHDAQEIVKSHERESVFFQEDRTLQKSFSKNMTLINVDTDSQYTNELPHFEGSYLITGEAGCGKSEILKHDFHTCWRRQCRRRRLSAKTGTYYFDAEALLNLLKEDGRRRREELLARIKAARLRKLLLYVDGVDELTDDNMERFRQILAEIQDSVQVLVPRFSCRTEFANKHLRENHFDHRYAVKPWEQVQLAVLSDQILDSLKEEHFPRLQAVRNDMRHGEIPWNFINSPLLLKLLLYMKLYGQHDIALTSNKFSFYSEFFRTLISVYQGRNHHASYDVDHEIDEVAKAVFDAYTNREKTVSSFPSLAPILKQRSGQRGEKVGLTHETFYEYLVARYYHIQFQKDTLSRECVDVMKSPYSNDFADFITDAFSADSEEQQILTMKLMVRLYAYTLLPSVRDMLQRQFAIENLCDQTLSDSMNDTLSAVSEKQNPFLTLKYEIIFRMGRFPPEIERDMRIRFLEFVYEYDTNTGAKYDQPYFEAVLKRCCAISASFLGGERVELDYIRQMLDFGTYPYDENYDLANRSHTLVYYSDVPDSNLDTFRDRHAENSWSFARAKRMERLAFPLPDSISDMTAKEKKKFYFRAFDIATIYTFLRSRPHQTLSPEELHILTDFKIDFIGMSDERRTILRDMKEETLRLAQSRG